MAAAKPMLSAEQAQRTPVLHLDQVAVPFTALAGFIRSQDPEVFERAGFLVSPRYGLAFVFRVFPHVAYALVTDASNAVEVGDSVSNPMSQQP